MYLDDKIFGLSHMCVINFEFVELHSIRSIVKIWNPLLLGWDSCMRRNVIYMNKHYQQINKRFNIENLLLVGNSKILFEYIFICPCHYEYNEEFSQFTNKIQLQSFRNLGAVLSYLVGPALRVLIKKSSFLIL